MENTQIEEKDTYGWQEDTDLSAQNLDSTNWDNSLWDNLFLHEWWDNYLISPFTPLAKLAFLDVEVYQKPDGYLNMSVQYTGNQLT